MRGGWVAACGVSANEYSCAHGAQINFGDLTSYLTYDCKITEAKRERSVHGRGEGRKTGRVSVMCWQQAA